MRKQKKIMHKYWLIFLICIGCTIDISAQQISVTQYYELTNAILQELKPRATPYSKMGVDGNYYWRNMPTDTPTVRLLLLDRPYDYSNIEEIVVSKSGVADFNPLRGSFTLADIQYMKRQLVYMKQFKFSQTYLKQDWVTVIPLDTLKLDAENQRKNFGEFADMILSKEFFKQYGSLDIYSISGILFSINRQNALVSIDDGVECDICIYTKNGRKWRRKRVVSSSIR